jgi:hypothetical protein
MALNLRLIRQLRDEVYDLYQGTPDLMIQHVIRVRTGEKALSNDSPYSWGMIKTERFGLNEMMTSANVWQAPKSRGRADAALLANRQADVVRARFTLALDAVASALHERFHDSNLFGDRMGLWGPSWCVPLEYLYFAYWSSPGAVSYRVTINHWDDEPRPPADGEHFHDMSFLVGDGFAKWKRGEGPAPIMGTFLLSLTRDARICVVSALDAILAEPDEGKDAGFFRSSKRSVVAALGTLLAQRSYSGGYTRKLEELGPGVLIMKPTDKKGVTLFYFIDRRLHDEIKGMVTRRIPKK